MWNARKVQNRLMAALRHRDIDPNAMSLRELMDCLCRRGLDQAVYDVVCGLLTILEPPNCYMTHCKNYGGQRDFCGCRLAKVPGRCGIYRAFKKRKAARAAKMVGGA